MTKSRPTRALIGSERISRHLARVVLFASMALAGYIAFWAWLNVKADYPMEYRENAILFTSDLLVQGHNPYSLQDRPVYVNGFGIGYYWAAYPFVRLGGNSYLTLRIVSLLFVVAACGLLAWALRLDNVSWSLAIAAAFVLFSQLGQGLSIVARPDSFGLFLLLASLLIPYRFRFSAGSLAAGAALSILGCLSKPYFLLGIPALFLYVFLFENKLRAVVFGVSSALAFFIVMFLMDRFYECYLTDTFFASLGGATRSWKHLAQNGGDFVIINFGFIFLLLARFIFARDGKDNSPAQTRGTFRGRKLGAPLLSVKISFPGFVLLVHSLVLIFLLGLHTGNDILYYHQLASPFLLWIAFWLAAVRFQRHWPFTLAILVNIAVFAYLVPPLPKDYSPEWRMVEQQIAMRTNVFTAAHLSHLLQHNGAPVYDNGHTEAVLGAFKDNFTRVSEPYRAKTEAFLQDIRDKVRNKKFDAVIVCHGWSPLLPLDELQQHYVSVGLLPAPMTFGYWLDPYPLEVWVPR